ncbi:MAG TPA: right-handed parallel beta-helix repeat-containing protein [Planctomycetota bacterium]|nr:right-handed parallel beta-helix repeat-containing protein [Planctomycetota bacterium]
MRDARLVLCALVLCGGHAASQDVLHVRAGAGGAADGSSWADAFPELVPALAAAQAGDQVWVAKGAYTPAAGGLDPDARFLLPDGVGVYGGFAGNELTLAQRDPATHLVVLSGDLLGDDALGEAHWVDNSHSLLLAAGTGPGTVLDGFIIRGGHGDPFASLLPGGLRVQGGSITLRACAFLQNSGATGALLCGQPGTTVVDTCLFADNRGGFGPGAIKTNHDHVLDLRNSVFSGNTGYDFGGALQLVSSTATLYGCLFSGNRTSLTTGGGGAIHALNGSLKVFDCTFTGNVSVANASSGGALSEEGATLVIRNSILWGDVAQAVSQGQMELDATGGSVQLLQCLFQGWAGQFPGGGNLDLDPLFVDALGPDGVAGTMDDVCFVQPGSPAIDSASNAGVPADSQDADHDHDALEPCPLDLRLVGRFEDDPDTPDLPGQTAPVVDRGAFEFSRWGNLGHALGGPWSPLLVGFGSLTPGLAMGLRITGTRPFAFGFLFIGNVATGAPFKGGVMVPFPALGVGLTTDGSGSLTAPSVLPSFMPSQLVLYLQAWFMDVSAPYGFSATNAVSATVK